MPEYITAVIDCETGETIERPMTDEEIATVQKVQADASAIVMPESRDKRISDALDEASAEITEQLTTARDALIQTGTKPEQAAILVSALGGAVDTIAGKLKEAIGQ